MSGAVYAKYGSLGPKKTEEPDVPPCLEVQNLEHRRNILKSNSVVCIDLYGTWCEPCKLIDNDVCRLNQTHNSSGRCVIVKENIDLELTRDVNIQGVPAFIFYKMNQLVREKDGKPKVIVGGDLKEVDRVLRILTTESRQHQGKPPGHQGQPQRQQGQPQRQQGQQGQQRESYGQQRQGQGNFQNSPQPRGQPKQFQKQPQKW